MTSSVKEVVKILVPNTEHLLTYFEYSPHQL